MILRFKIDRREALRTLWKLSYVMSPERLYSLLAEEAEQSVKNVKSELSHKWHRGQYLSIGKPRFRSGQLHDSIGYRVVKASRVQGAEVDFGVVGRNKAARTYAWVQELGYTFRSRGKLLAIPLSPALEDDGTLRFKPLEAKRFYPQGTFIKNRIIYGRQNRLRIPLFKLKETNKVPRIPRDQHEFLSPEGNDLAQRIRDRLADLMREATGNAKG